MESLQKGNFSLKENVHLRFQELFTELKKRTQYEGQFILVLDEYAIKLVSSCLKMSHLIKFGVSQIEKLHLKRKRYSKLQAIYILSPTKASIEQLIQDFIRKKDKPQYGKAHIYLTSRLSKELLESIAKHEILVKKIKTIKELNHDFLFIEQNAFHLDIENSLQVLYSKQNSLEMDILIEKSSEKLTTIFPGLLRFKNCNIYFQKGTLSEQFANSFKLKFKDYYYLMQDSKNKIIDQESGNVHLIIFDRKADPITPLLYDFYYQSIIYDLLDIDNDTNIVEYKINKKNDQQETKKAQISDEGDEVFIKYRYKHIAESLEGIPNDFQNLVNTNSTAQMGKCNAEDLDLDKMQQIIKDMPQYNELLGKYSMHMYLIEQAWKIFEEKGLKQIGEYQLQLATGIDDSGKKLQSQKIVKQLKEILEKREISGIDKLRVALSAYIAIDLCEADRKTIISCFTDQEAKALLNLSWFGITFTDSKKNKNVSEIRKLDEKILKQAKKKLEASKFDLCKHTPISAILFEQLIFEIINQNNQNIQDIGFDSLYVGNQNSKNEKKEDKKNNNILQNKNMELANLLQNKGVQQEDEDQFKKMQKVIVFYLGGVTYAEIRQIRDVQQKNNYSFPIIIGSTQIMNPKQYLKALQSMNPYS